MIVVALFAFLSIYWINEMWWLHSPTPFADDFSCISFISDWVQNPNVLSLFEIHNEHTQLVLKVLTILSYTLRNELSFSFLTRFSLCIPIIFSLFFGYYLKNKLQIKWDKALLFSLPVVLITAQPGAWSGYLWVTSALTHGIIPLIVLLTIYLFEKKYFILILCVGLIGVFSGGAGIFLPIILIIVLFGAYSKNLRKITIVFYSLIILLTLILISNNTLLAGNISDFLNKDDSLINSIKYTLIFIGNVFVFDKPFFAIISGILLLLPIIFVRFSTAPALISVCLLTIFAGFSSAILRYPTGGLSHAMLSRYQVYSTTYCVALYGIYLIQMPKYRKIIFAICLSIFGLTSLKNYIQIPDKVRSRYLVQNRDYILSKFDRSIVVGEYPPRVATDEILDRAKKLNVFDIKLANFFAKYIETNVEIPKVSTNIVYSLDDTNEDPEYLFYQGWSLLDAKDIVIPEKICLIVADENDITKNSRICFPKRARDEIHQLIKERNFKIPDNSNFGFSLFFPKELIKFENYKVGLMLQGKKNWHVEWFLR